MAITQGTCVSFLSELLEGVHDFTADTFKVALYGSSASLGPSTTAYTATGEVSGTNYTAGGKAVSVASSYPQAVNSAVHVDFDDVEWASSTISGAVGALIYNSSKSNRAVAVLAFGAAISSENATFTLTFPDPNSEPVLRLIAG